MDVRLLIGPAGSGKTRACIEALRECERAGRRGVLLVPDQFTYAADRLLLEEGGLPGTRCVRVLSFRRLAHLLAAEAGGPAVVSEPGRRMLLRAVVHVLSPEELGPLAGVRETTGLVTALAALLREVKGIAGRAAAERLHGSGGEDRKVAALARVITAYDRVIDEAGLADREERIHAAAERLARQAGDWRERPIWVDGFASFTPEDKVLLAALARAAPAVTITLCADPGEARAILREAGALIARGAWTSAGEFLARRSATLARPVFLPTLRSLLWLRETCGRALTIEVLSDRPRYRASPRLAQLEAGLFRQADGRGAAPDEGAPRPGGAPRPVAAAPDAVAVTRLQAAYPYQEVQAWARLIDRWVRLAPEGPRYRDVAVIVRDLDAYRPLVREVFERYGIPYFIDERRDATAHPLLRLVLGALQLAGRGWTREAVIGLMRNPLCALPAETADRIEHLSIEYAVEFERWWESRWEVFDLPERMRLELPRASEEGAESSAGGEEEEPDAEEQPAESEEDGTDLAGQAAPFDPTRRRRELAAVEARTAAQRLFPAWRAFCQVWQAGPVPFRAGATAVRELIRQVAGQESPPVPTWSRDESARIAELLEQTLSNGEALMGAVPVDAARFGRLLRDALAHASIGQTPRSLDAAIVAEPRRARVNEVRRVILGGLDAEAFPRLNVQDPLFSDTERERLSSGGLPMAYTAAQQSEEDPYFFYIAATRATEQLVLSYPTHAVGGAECEPSIYLAEVARALGTEIPAVADEPGRSRDASELPRCQHASELPRCLARELRAAGAGAAGLACLEAECRAELAAFAAQAELGLACARHLGRDLPEQLEAALIPALFPTGEIATSVSRLETFARCPFQFFARYLMRLEPPPEPRLTPRNTGSAAHAALERFFAAQRRGEGAVVPARIREIFAELARREEYRVFQEDPSSAYLWDRTRRGLEFFLKTELERLAQSTFRPWGFELDFSLPAGEGPTPEAARAALERGESPALPALVIDLAAADTRALALPADRAWRIRLRGRIDRLDVRAGAGETPQAVVFDYKASPRPGSVHQEILQGMNLQVGLYLLAVRRLLGLAPAGGLYYVYAPRPRHADRPARAGNPLAFEMKGIFLEREREAIDRGAAFLKPPRGKGYPQAIAAERLDVLLASAEQRMREAALEILRGRIRPIPAATSRGLPCPQCDYASVCRFDPHCHAVRVPEAREADHG